MVIQKKLWVGLTFALVIFILTSHFALAWINAIVGCAIGGPLGLVFGGMGVNCFDYNFYQEGYESSNYNCNLCNNFNEFGLIGEDLTKYFEPCTEYRCRSIGPGCEWAAAQDDNSVGVCIRKDCSEVTPPKITNCEVRDPLSRGEFGVTEGNGCKINDAIPEFSGAAIMLETDEEARCRFSTIPNFDFNDEATSVWFGSPDLEKRHFFLLSVFDANETLISECNAGNCNLYVKCKDLCGNTMRNSYAISFNVEEGPDLEPPRIISTLAPSGALIPSGITGIEFRMNVVDQTGIESCKWTKDKFELYDDIKTEDRENEGLFECDDPSSNWANYIEEGVECTTMLRGLEDEADNVFYLTCRDDSDQKNVLKPYVEFILKGTSPLNITSYELPEGVVYDLTQEISVSTSREATCYSKINNEEREEFNNTGTMSHSTELELDLGNVNLEVICQDIAGNEDRVSSSFSVEEDRIAPRLEQLYSDLSYLTIVLDEEAKCEYSDEQFTYGEGTAMIPNDFAKKHQAAIGQDVYYIKCRDQFENELSMVVYP